MRKLPSFFVIGTQKAGTTTLHDWLSQQPDVSLPAIKETHFFSHVERYKRGIDWYLRQYRNANTNTVTGEIDPEYMFYENAPLRIRKHIESPKIIIILRNPVERAYSHYLMSVRRGYEPLLFNEALAAEEIRLGVADNEFALNHHSYITRGYYYRQINHYRNVFPDSNFLYIKFEDLVSEINGHAIYKMICDFIGAKSSPSIAKRNIRSNLASASRFCWLRDILYDSSRFKIIRKLVLPHDLRMKLWRVIDRLNSKPIASSDQAESIILPREFAISLKKDIAAVMDETGLECVDWIRAIDKCEKAFSAEY